jgi:hypothetical protein
MEERAEHTAPANFSISVFQRFSFYRDGGRHGNRGKRVTMGACHEPGLRLGMSCGRAIVVWGKGIPPEGLRAEAS